MKRVILPVVSLVLVMSVLLSFPVNASAAPILNDSSTANVSWISGDKTFSADAIEIVNLPGTTTLSSGLIVPAGFTIAGEKQFEGSGIQVSGFESGKLKACFPISGIVDGWGGKVGRWNGSKWDLLATTISTPAESAISWGCATISQNGTYALLKWVVDPTKLPQSKPDCGYTLVTAFGLSFIPPTGDDPYYGNYDDFAVAGDSNLDGKTITVSLYSSEPAGSYSLSNSFSGTLEELSEGLYVLTVSPSVTWTMYTSNTGYSYLIDFGSCSQVVPHAFMAE